ncbi:DNA-binding response regulator, OmpR family, contains REC and winged-helix (wHTH) domain [Pedococcus cremeus]|uniref:DNA-binding response regulator, OmpR family, contains REC and winged-helix (WHTH) domain n=1 Tax=Pedococcus cremeus TaxID=587636 RepID=A0A1H9X7Z3_9MICO|nr:response regulator transcription factor [Pedococcus cremeus]SES42260.1 DNA-binding response regulator, OmpR family, contains REC and winged-helix (wHTH) domain [Pedococcus cremeus]
MRLPTYPEQVARVLVIDDDATVSEVVVAYLEAAGLEARRAGDGPSGLAAAAAEPPDAVVLDLMLPGIDGLEVCRRLRLERPDLPVVMLTARGEEEDRVLGLEVGADDYVTKPFSPRELVLRLQSVLRRTMRPAAGLAPSPVPPAGAGLADGDLLLDRLAHRATLGGRELSLTTREFELLAWLLAHPGQAFAREELMRSVWGWEYGDQSTVTVHVRRLREKVEADPSTPTRLVTVFGVGYRWDPVSSPDAAASADAVPSPDPAAPSPDSADSAESPHSP